MTCPACGEPDATCECRDEDAHYTNEGRDTVWDADEPPHRTDDRRDHDRHPPRIL